MQPSLDLDPQDGDTEFFEALQSHFGIRLAQADVGDWLTLGDVHATIVAKLPDPSAIGFCPTAHVFNRFRSALVEMGHQRSAITRHAALETFSNGRPTTFSNKLATTTGLNMPSNSYRILGKIGSWMLFVGGIGALVLLLKAEGPYALYPLIAAAIGFALMMVDRGTFPAGVASLGDLAARTSALNRLGLKSSGARDMPNGTWEVLMAIASEQSGIASEKIGPDTFLFQSTFEARRNG